MPSPFQRIGVDLSIGIVGMQFRGYFAVTSATVQGGSSMRVWGDVGIASFEGGFEFNAIIYIVPKFRFEVDLHVWAGIEVFGIDFASVDLRPVRGSRALAYRGPRRNPYALAIA